MAVALALVSAMTVLPIPLLVGRALDQTLGATGTGMLFLLGGSIVALAAVSTAAKIGATTHSARASAAAVAEARREAVDRLLAIPRRIYAATDSGTLHDQIVHETERVDEAANSIFNNLLPAVVMVIGVAGILAFMNPVLMLVTLAWAPVIYFVSRRLGHRVDHEIDVQHRGFEGFSRGVLGLLRSMDLVRIQSAEGYERTRQGAVIGELAERSSRLWVWIAVYGTSQQTLISLASASVLVAGGIAIVDGRMSVGELIAFFAGIGIIRGPLSNLSNETPTVIEGLRSLRRLNALVDAVDDRPYRGGQVVDFAGAIDVAGVTFGYTDTPVIEDVTLGIRPGTVVGLAGPNGSGKSTIVNMIVGFYRPDAGTVLADGVPYDALDLTALRRGMGVVPQTPVFVNESVAANIVYGRPGFTQADVWRALDIACGREFVMDLEQGLETVVGEDGVFLSGGQRQRLAIARAVIHRPRLLILDEPTNHLDRQTIGRVFDNLTRLHPQPGVLVVSHDTEILDGISELVRIKDGRLVTGG